jgi:asparagine synthase (glutamine-hydrolysing)
VCGVAGIVRRRGSDPADPRRLRAMCDAIVHRGPDDHGYLLLDSRSGARELTQTTGGAAATWDVLLGSRRLAIVDTSSAGRQPMASPCADVFVVFNGEIYNHDELRADLAGRGHRFGSRTDTEVIVHAYEEWGTECVGRFNGMWAFAIWDQARRRLFCSRDRFGVKPFYYFVDGERFVFGSEIKALLPALPARPAPHWPTMHAYLARGIVCEGEDTFFDGVRRLPPAHNLVVIPDATRLERYWRYDTRSHAYDDAQPASAFRAIFDDAVRLRTRSEVALGVSLSGGMDSTAVTALARRHRDGAPLDAFTATFPDSAHDEARHAEVAARRYGLALHTTAYRPGTLVDDLRRVVWHLDYPSLLAQILPRWAVMDLAAAHGMKVVLEGQGSDEMLAGYPHRYFGAWLWDELDSSSPTRKLRALAIAAARRAGRARQRWAGNALRGYTRAEHGGVLSADFVASGPPVPEAPASDGPAGRLGRALRFDHGQRILPHLLKLGDAISMAHSIEVRLPFLDYRLVELIFGLPSEQKFDGRRSKIVLRRALADVLPPEILARTDKVGFGTPTRGWVEPSIDAEVRPLLLSERARARGIFDPVALDRALAVVDSDPKAQRVLRWISVELWFRLFIDGARDPAAPA